MADKLKPIQRTGWLWWLAGLIAFAAGLMVYFIKQDTGNIRADETIKLVILVASISVGICIISATSHWWLKR